MVRHTYTYVRPNTSVLWWEDEGRESGIQEIITLFEYHLNFFNNVIDTAAGERWSLVDTDELTKVFTIECSQERLTQIMDTFAQDNNLVSLRYLNDDYNNKVGITSTVATVEI